MSTSTNESLDFGHRVTGLIYHEFLRNMHEHLNPRNYFEIGTLHGVTLANAKCPSIAVDPVFRLQTDVMAEKPTCHLYQQTSDDFFAEQNLTELFGEPVDFAFLDGMHLFEFLLRDFINTEKQCENGSIIALHDCLPLDHYMTVRSPDDPIRLNTAYEGYWTGDVWKIVPALQKYRPDLSITVIDCVGTGLVLVTNLDPNSTVLADNSQVLVEDNAYDFGADRLHAYWNSVAITPAERLLDSASLAAKFRL
ncbi:class I SAM-dependent methyltransferase [Mesorhizobium sp. M3A.F.Ca.ET.080.04.2.1]|uniref:class I SAM-dependent methyltransferase n=1 Tax=Mesorhizobium sp. M3A.F.Ca.ET.080.04.2.1 TaxID=2493676 RepID=UPI000F75A82C|nr:class I SAM-dependent methyltransferase [Mesorhizobium sp. M3A.F.Ca.ET.080.04.2.1]AZO09176.1 class I SAM-dependent methyltransferase [Mesorhizobium sp. M3A.F.Ca.ET.080.04.2.1]RWF20086.1 MAG: class I SAM-dependent methyltransferase [Mesorhizobium sp.]